MAFYSSKQTLDLAARLRLGSMPTLIAVTLVGFLCLQISTVAETSPNISYNYPYSGVPTNLVISMEKVFVTMQHRILVFESDFSSSQEYQFDVAISRMIAATDALHNVHLLVCFYDGCCSTMQEFDIYSPNCHQKSALPGTVPAISSTGMSFVVASAAGSIKFCQLDVLYMYFLNDPICDVKSIDNPNFLSRIFMHSFSDSEFLYFIVKDNYESSQDTELTLVRKCIQDNATYGISPATFEIKLDCGPTIANTSVVGLFTLNETVIIGLYDNLLGSRFCVFSTREVNERITQAFENCVAGNHNFVLPWSMPDPHQCTYFDMVSLI